MNMRDGWSFPFRYVVGILCLGALIAFLLYARQAVTNLVIAAFVAYLINPAVVYLTETTRMARTAAGKSCVFHGSNPAGGNPCDACAYFL